MVRDSFLPIYVWIDALHSWQMFWLLPNVPLDLSDTGSMEASRVFVR